MLYEYCNKGVTEDLFLREIKNTHENCSLDPRVWSICTVQRVTVVHPVTAWERRSATYSRSHAGCSQGGSLESHTEDLSLKMGLQIFYKICNIL